MDKQKNSITRYSLTIIGIVLGAIAGFTYYHFIGCSSGTCPITSHPLNSTLYGAVMGGLLFNIIQDYKFKHHDNN